MTFTDNWNYCMKFYPDIKRIVGPLLLVDAPLDIDKTQATDMIVIGGGRAPAIACRVRRPEQICYAGEFTIRSRLANGCETELSKIISGWADWMFYGFGDPDGANRVVLWAVIDLKSFRAHLIRNGKIRSRMNDAEKRNIDGTYFMPFRIDSFKGAPDILIAKSDDFDRVVNGVLVA